MLGRRRCHTGFALLDLMIAMVIVGVAVAAVVQLFFTGTTVNSEATKLTVAVNLAQQIHEYAMTLPHRGALGRPGRTHGEVPPDCDDVSDLDDWTFTQVVDSKCQPLTGFEGWSQYVRVYSTPEFAVTGAAIAPSGSAPKRLVVSVRYKGAPIHTEQWILAPTVPPTIDPAPAP